jgi:hypothetical protein
MTLMTTDPKHSSPNRRDCRRKSANTIGAFQADDQVMHQNITKVAERGERLDALQDKTGTFVPQPFPILRLSKTDK